ncbi:uncharacterized protein LOC126845026 isoform X1 [Adelges cooleyi]|uniref:uncharacterized protein LOC126845026 isoform X1 n=1 Tax=Adelges cooleyi TaxID=133065 RepID=UPI00217FFD13|nr:uncharacterized protein LOC126845026 isoform X1 [Adelges cooleyi]XP_050439557.1 uncharacterized protein LOC126845026 isoform X1 [Adelges cooleyi]XP_050439558.1 uncharacterized protein LOC126845026 isoform X1 [Adelges cooleyi]XP_050439559.1 uncharacterized protein LOC126845026 isoform X1 [Adelges cooleyi]
MKLFYVIVIYAFLNVVANGAYNTEVRRNPEDKLTDVHIDTENVEDRKNLETTNELIRTLVNRKTAGFNIKNFAWQHRLSMKHLTFMFAIPEQDCDNNSFLQYIMELYLQQKLIEHLGHFAVKHTPVVKGLDSMDDLGAKRRDLLLKPLGDLITNIINQPKNHHVEFIHICRIIGLFMSVQDPKEYATNAAISLDHTCVISHGETVIKSCKYVGTNLHNVDNENHMSVGKSITLEL